MIPVVGVRFKTAGKIYYFDPGSHELVEGNRVIVETAQGLEYGEVAVGIKHIPKEDVIPPIRCVVRVASEDDLEQISDCRADEKDAFEYADERANALGLDMKIVDVEWAFDRQKLTFYFVADERVDFRELVRQLAAMFRTRIELRQIGVRDQSKMVGGYGVCGRALCCATWIGDFEPISIRHAKEQDLSLSPGKISGVCGRLKCCLRFEADMYKEIRDTLPKVGTMATSVHGTGKVIESHVIKESVTLLIDDGDEFKRVEVHVDDITWDGKPGAAEVTTAQLAAAADATAKDTVSNVASEETNPGEGAAPRHGDRRPGKKNKRRKRHASKPRGRAGKS